jgi:Zn-dependent protease
MLFGIPIGDLITLVICLLVSTTIHEFMHAYVGYRLGDTTALEHGRISFNPLRHIDPVMTVLLPIVTLALLHAPILAAKPVPFDPRQVKYGEYGAALLAVAGPLSNLLLAILGAFLFEAVSGYDIKHVLALFIQLNVSLFVFNMIPIPPLDGSRVLYAFAPESVQEVMQRIEPYGLVIVFALVMWGGAGDVIVNLNNFVLNLLP